MKKLLVLMLVLGMASLANAALITGNVTWDGDTPGKLIGTGTALGPVDLNLALSTFTTVTGTVSIDPTTDGRPGAMLIAGNAGNVVDWDTYYNVLGGEIGESIPPQSLGVWFSFDVASDATVDLYDSVFGYIGSIEVTPEPMTMVLLGIGGLFLRRRK